MIDRRKLIGFAAMVVVVLALVAAQVLLGRQRSIGVVEPVVVGVMLVALAAALFAPGRYFDGPRRPLYAVLPIVVFFALALKLLTDGQEALALASAIGAVVFVVLQIRQHPRADAAGEHQTTA